MHERCNASRGRRVLLVLCLWIAVASACLFVGTPHAYAEELDGFSLSGLGGSGPALTTQGAKSYDKQRISKSNPAVVIRVSYATSGFNEGWGGTIEAARVKKQEGYELYDVVLWPDRISCYRFGKDLDDLWDEYWEKYISTHDSSMSNDVFEKEYRKMRESYCICTTKVRCGKSENLSNSAAKYRAFTKIFKAVKKRTPSKHVVLKYSGHGGGANLFNAINESYTKKTLAAGTKIFGAKFAIIDYGTNCRSASARTLDMYAPYTDYMIMCQQDFGGWQWDSRTQNADGTIKRSYLYRDSDSWYHEAFGLGKRIRDAARKLADLNRDEWTTLAKSYIKKHQIRCSNVAVDTKAFAKLRKAMKRSNKLSSYDGNDVYASIKGDAKLRKLYKKSIVRYRRTKELGVAWSKYENGISIV